jgi:hypothetical protein
LLLSYILQYAPSSRLAIRAPRPRSSTDLAIRGPLAIDAAFASARQRAFAQRVHGVGVPLILLGEELVDLLDGLCVLLLVRYDADTLQNGDASRMILELGSAALLSQQVAPATLETRDGVLATIAAVLAQGVDVSAG